MKSFIFHVNLSNLQKSFNLLSHLSIIYWSSTNLEVFLLCSQAVMNEDPTTTNCCEGYNNAIQLSIPHKASIWSIMKHLKAEEALVTVKPREAGVGAGQDNSSRITYRRQRRNELKELVTNFSVLSKKSFMDYMISYYNHDLSFVVWAVDRQING